jgi:proteasome accessory factor C
VTAAATDRLSRLLALVPYLVSRQGIPLAEAAAEFGISQAQLVKDLELLFVCGTPGHLPDDLIDVDWDDGHVFLSNADPIARPLRLGVDEALALLVGLRALTDVPGLHDRDALQRTLLKLEAAAGESAAASSQVRVEVEAQGPLAEVRRALAEGCRVHLSYFVPARDETTERDVDPMRVSWSTASGTSRDGAGGPRTSVCSASTGSTPSPFWTCRPRCLRPPPSGTWRRACSSPAPTTSR